MVIDTLFMCYCEDVNQNDGSPGKEYFAPPSLKAFMEDSEDAGDGAAVAMQPMQQRQPSREEAV